MNKGFTLTEILITIVILAVLAGVALPNFSKLVTKAEANKAITTLRVIRTAQKMFYAKNATYACTESCVPAAVPTEPPVCSYCENAAAINAALGTEITDGKYQFAVHATTPTTFTAFAYNDSNTANFIDITHDGLFGAGGNCGPGTTTIPCATYLPAD